jgi:phospholipid/cholesterol/gamma-HCH transport system substrate-binding protein
MSRTAPALSLTDLFNGFRPLFSALSPQQVNELSQDIIDVLQGQTDRVEDLISRTADLTRNLADRDQTFGTVLDSLSTLLSTVSKHDDQLASVVTTLHAFTAQLHSDGPAVLDSLNAVDQLVGSAAGLFQNLEDHNLPADVADAASLTKVLGGNTGTLAKLLSGFSAAFGTFARVSQNGNWINIYACNVGVETYGSVNILASQIVGALAGLLNGVAPGLGTVLNGILASLGLSTDGSGLLGGLIGNPKLDVPLKLPNGPVGGSTAHSAVCS